MPGKSTGKPGVEASCDTITGRLREVLERGSSILGFYCWLSGRLKDLFINSFGYCPFKGKRLESGSAGTNHVLL